MSFTTPDYQAIRDAILRDIANQPTEDGTPRNVASDGDYAVRANATGAAIEGLYQHQQWIVRQIFPDRADQDYMEKHASLRKITYKNATAAVGTITFSGTPGSVVSIGAEAKTAGEVAYVNTASGVIGAGGTVTLAAQAVATGEAGNQAGGTALTLTAAPDGVLSTAEIATMTGGTDKETAASLLARLLFRLRNPPCGGAAHDYYAWALEVDGVTAAYVYRNRRGLGTTDVIILTEGGIPASGLVADVQTYIDTQAPVQADFLAFGPTAVPVNFVGTLTLAAGYSLAAVAAAIDVRLAAYFATLKPGGTAYLKQIESIISRTEGVVDFVLTSPAANVVAVVDATHTELATLGTTDWTAA